MKKTPKRLAAQAKKISKPRPSSPPYQGPERRRPILIVQHAPHEHPAVLRRVLECQGILTQWIHPYLGEPYPTAQEVGGIISLGGPMGANDQEEHPWILEECRLLRDLVERDRPVVGICLGGQLLARALGGSVERNPQAEVGWYPLELNPQGREDPLLGVAGESPVVYHWHGDTFFPPQEAVLLARSAACERQAYRIGKQIYGFQFHPEADHQLVHEWLSIEGVSEELDHFQKSHGRETVQDAETQRWHARKGEEASLRITAAIGSLFRQRPRKSPAPTLIQKIQSYIEEKTPITVEFEGSDRKLIRLKGNCVALFPVGSSHFVIFQHEKDLLWPIELGDIRRLNATRRKS